MPENDDIPLRQYIDQRMADMRSTFIALSEAKERLDLTRFTQVQISAQHASDSLDRRLEALNEMRQMLADNATRFMPRAEYDQAHRALVERIENVQRLMYIGLGVVTALQFVISIVVVILGRHIIQ